jgi:hypothetical protein
MNISFFYSENKIQAIHAKGLKSEIETMIIKY